MKTVINEKMIKTRGKIGNYLAIGSLVLMGISVFLVFQEKYFTYAFIAMLIGFIASQVGIYMGNRWGRSPRPDEVVSQALKGLDGKYTLYHYKSPVPHLLIGPAGIIAILTFGQGGKISYNETKKRWQQKGGNWYLKAFAQESLGRPDQEVEVTLDDLKRFIQKQLPGADLPEPQAVLIFSNPKVTIEAANAPVATMPADKLKDYIRKKAKSEAVPPEKIQVLEAALPSE